MQKDSVKVLVAHPDDSTRERLDKMLQSLDHQVLGLVGTGRELIEEAGRGGAELIIASMDLEDMDGIEALLAICRDEPKPAIVVTRRSNLEEVEKALEDHVMAYMVEPITAQDLRPTIYLVRRRFEQFQELRQEVESLQDALEARKQIERAKGLLMARQGLAEEDAYKRLRKAANDRRITIRKVAEALLLSEEIHDRSEPARDGD